MNDVVKQNAVWDPSLDIMKGIAMLLVIIGHCTRFAFDFIYSFHMPVFFIISGYLMKDSGMRAFLKKDFQRLIIPYICTAIIIIIAMIRFKTFFPRETVFAAMYGYGSSINTAKYLSEVPNIGSIWFLFALFWGKIVTKGIMKLKSRLVIILVLFFFSSILGRYVICLPFSILPGLCCVPFLAYGFWLKQNGGFENSPDIITKLFVIIWLVCIFFSEMNIARCYFQHYILNIAGGIGGTLCLYRISYKLIGKKASKVFTFIGRNSICFLCMSLIINILLLKQFTTIGTVIFLLLEVIGCSIVICALSKISFTKKLLRIQLS